MPSEIRAGRFSKSFNRPQAGESSLITLAPERNRLDRVHPACDGRRSRRGPRPHGRIRAASFAKPPWPERSLSTHLGNGIASLLPRHPNPIWEQAALESLSASFIADGHHLDQATLRVLAMAKGPARTILVSDASPLAGLPPGHVWRVGNRAIRPDRCRRHAVPRRVECRPCDGHRQPALRHGLDDRAGVGRRDDQSSPAAGPAGADARSRFAREPGRVSTARAGRICADRCVD